MKKAVCALIYDHLGQVLTVSRENNPEDKGLPGGKVEEGETLEQAIAREVFEETGLIVINSTPIFTAIAKGEVDYNTTTFRCDVKGDIHTEEKGVVKYVDWIRLLFPVNSFREYNLALYNHIHKTNW